MSISLSRTRVCSVPNIGPDVLGTTAGGSVFLATETDAIATGEGSQIDLTGSFSVLAWLYVYGNLSESTYYSVLSVGDDLMLGIMLPQLATEIPSSMAIKVNAGSDAGRTCQHMAQTTAALESLGLPLLSRWYHVALTFTSGRLTLYLDGVENSYADVDIKGLSGTLIIGAKLAGNCRAAPAFVDEVSLLRTALSVGGRGTGARTHTE
eukprot:Blabericola_migrator_1__11243@NODE_660_length_7013_cov_22_730636_g482_i0_p3_GENE_NODE_660_length_7013_cov_22_730636_g482_i0NODE_660_length_7013_cov_22_730636_g482_i0_p3_ORF_typecomplete_len208_score17_24Laminin_G_3/PF13385_6/6_4e13Pentaxin/PF00354_17/0_0052_NODE_660_length_7013_cov_22_730636_g482_i011221745